MTLPVKGEQAKCYKDQRYMVKTPKVAIYSPVIGQGVSSLHPQQFVQMVTSHRRILGEAKARSMNVGIQ